MAPQAVPRGRDAGLSSCFLAALPALAGPRPLGVLAEDGSHGLRDPPGCFTEQCATGSSAGSAEEREEHAYGLNRQRVSRLTPPVPRSLPRVLHFGDTLCWLRLCGASLVLGLRYV